MPKIALLATLCLASWNLAVASSGPTTIAVMPFAAQEGEREAWLSKGLADLFARHLAEIPAVSVVERETIQSFLNEMDLGQAPLFDQAQALRLGRVAKVREVLYGSYSLRGHRITVTVFCFDLEKKAILSTDADSGSLQDLVPMVRGLTERLLKKRGTPLAAAAERRLQRGGYGVFRRQSASEPAGAPGYAGPSPRR